MENMIADGASEVTEGIPWKSAPRTVQEGRPILPHHFCGLGNCLNKCSLWIEIFHQKKPPLQGRPFL